MRICVLFLGYLGCRCSTDAGLCDRNLSSSSLWSSWLLKVLYQTMRVPRIRRQSVSTLTSPVCFFTGQRWMSMCDGEYRTYIWYRILIICIELIWKHNQCSGKHLVMANTQAMHWINAYAALHTHTHTYITLRIRIHTYIHYAYADIHTLHAHLIQDRKSSSTMNWTEQTEQRRLAHMFWTHLNWTAVV